MSNRGYKNPSPLRIALFHSYRALAEGMTSGGGTYEGSVAQVLEEVASAIEAELIHVFPRAGRLAPQLPKTIRGSKVIEYRPTFFERWASEKPHTWLARWIVEHEWLNTSRRLLGLGVDLAYFSSPSHMALRMGTLPFIFTVWDTGHRDLPDFPEMSSPKEYATRENLYQNAVPNAFHVMVDSPTTGGKLEEFYGLRPDRWSSIGLLPQVNKVADLPRRIAGDYIIYPAARWPHKNHVTLFEAMRSVLDKSPEIKLVLTGYDAGFGEELSKKLKALEIEESVFDLGLVSREELLALIRDAKALVMPSLLGPTNIPPLEALALGTHAIVSDAHHYGTDIDDSLVVVPATDPSAWAEAILRALSQKDPEPQEFTYIDAIATHREVFERFQSEKISRL